MYSLATGCRCRLRLRGAPSRCSAPSRISAKWWHLASPAPVAPGTCCCHGRSVALFALRPHPRRSHPEGPGSCREVLGTPGESLGFSFPSPRARAVVAPGLCRARDAPSPSHPRRLLLWECFPAPKSLAEGSVWLLSSPNPPQVLGSDLSLGPTRLFQAQAMGFPGHVPAAASRLSWWDRSSLFPFSTGSRFRPEGTHRKGGKSGFWVNTLNIAHSEGWSLCQGVAAPPSAFPTPHDTGIFPCWGHSFGAF